MQETNIDEILPKTLLFPEYYCILCGRKQDIPS